MRNAIRVVGVGAALVLCAASATSYQGSYRDTNLGGGMYMVVVEVNKHTTLATARQYAFQRAGEVCRGAGFTPVDADGNTYAGTGAVYTRQRVGDTSITTANTIGGGSDFTLVYTCNSTTSTGGPPGADYGAGVPRPEDLPRQ